MFVLVSRFFRDPPAASCFMTEEAICLGILSPQWRTKLRRLGGRQGGFLAGASRCTTPRWLSCLRHGLRENVKLTEQMVIKTT